VELDRPRLVAPETYAGQVIPLQEDLDTDLLG
jgi:hypothetical protein